MNKSIWNTIILSVIGAATVSLLSGCGGGGETATAIPTPIATPTPMASTANFPLRSGYMARMAAGSSDNYTISGSCTGSATLAYGAATAASLQSVTAYSAAYTTTMNLTNCRPSTIAGTGTMELDANYSTLSYNYSQKPATDFAKYASLPTALPVSVRVGDMATYVTFNTYTDSAMATPTGQRVASYLIEADGANTAILNFITKSYNTAGQLISTQQIRLRIAADGTLTAVSVDIQDSTTSTTHLLLTKV